MPSAMGWQWVITDFSVPQFPFPASICIECSWGSPLFSKTASFPLLHQPDHSHPKAEARIQAPSSITMHPSVNKQILNTLWLLQSAGSSSRSKSSESWML